MVHKLISVAILDTLAKGDRLMFIQDSTLHYSMPTFNSTEYDRQFLNLGVIPGSFRISCQARNCKTYISYVI